MGDEWEYYDGDDDDEWEYYEEDEEFDDDMFTLIPTKITTKGNNSKNQSIAECTECKQTLLGHIDDKNDGCFYCNECWKQWEVATPPPPDAPSNSILIASETKEESENGNLASVQTLISKLNEAKFVHKNKSESSTKNNGLSVPGLPKLNEQNSYFRIRRVTVDDRGSESMSKHPFHSEKTDEKQMENEKKRSFIKNELIETEKTYLKGLIILFNEFLKPIFERKMIPKKYEKEVTSMIPSFIQFHTNFLMNLRVQLDKG